MKTLRPDVVVTGTGIVCPIGVGRMAVWRSLAGGVTGIRRVTAFDTSSTPIHLGGEVVDLDTANLPGPRKAQKVMSRDIQLGLLAAELAWRDTGLADGAIPPDRLGVVFGTDMIHCQPDELAEAFGHSLRDGKFDLSTFGHEAMRHIFPLWLLKYCPNMPASHVSLVRDARGPNNTITAGEVSSLAAIAEAADCIRRGQADVMICGGTGSRVQPWLWVRACQDVQASTRDTAAAAARPFDLDRSGYVNGEGAGALVLESRASAVARGARIVASVEGYACRHADPRAGGHTRRSVERAMSAVLAAARRSPKTVGFCSAHGLGTRTGDREEAEAIRAVLGSTPVTALKSYFGNLGSGAGAVEAVIGLMALERKLVPATLNHTARDPDCPIEVVSGRMIPMKHASVLTVNYTPQGQAAAMLFARA